MIDLENYYCFALCSVMHMSTVYSLYELNSAKLAVTSHSRSISILVYIKYKMELKDKRNSTLISNFSVDP